MKEMNIYDKNSWLVPESRASIIVLCALKFL